MRSLSTRAAGLLILALGIWGGLVPFVGHYFHFSLGPDQAWHWNRDRLFLDVLPGVAAALGGLMLIGSGPRRSARLGALLALVAGIWFAVGPDVSHLWNAAGAQGHTHGARLVSVLELVTYHTGLGALIAALGGYALPRFIAPVVADEAAEAGAGTAAGRRTGPMAAEREPAGDEAVAAAEPTGRAERERLEDEPVRKREWEDRPAALGATGASGAGRGALDTGRLQPRGEAEDATLVREPAELAGYAGDEPAGAPAAAEPADTEPAATAEPAVAVPARAAAPATAEPVTAAEPVASQPTAEPAAGEPGATPRTRVGHRRSGGLLSRLTGR
jgi:hypothetical protein